MASKLPRGKQNHSLRKKLRQLKSQNGRCYLNGCKMDLDPGSARRATWDHIIPRAMGGKRKQPNGKSNLKLACFACNVDKGDLSLDEYLRSKKST